MTRFWMLPVAATLALSACATPETRIASALMDYGFDRSTAYCVGDELEDRLSNRQLRTLARLASDVRRDGRDLRNMTIRDLADQVRRTGDPELFAVLTRAGIGCAVLG
jgi:transposase